MFGHILVATDFSPCAEDALGVAIEVARRFEAKLTLAHACEPPTYAYLGVTAVVDLVTPIQEAARELLKSAFEQLKTRFEGPAESLLLFGVAPVELLAAIEKHAVDLVVMGTRGRTGLSHVLIGSVAERVVRLSPVPVLTVRKRK